MGLSLSTSDAQHRDGVLHGALIHFENASLAFFWSGEKPRLGTLTVTLPDRSSSCLLGERDQQIGLILGSRISSLTGKMAIVSTNLPVDANSEAAKAMLDLIPRLLRKEKE